MGDFSRDPNARLQDSIAKHYVGVRLQQGVPILDTDWNELEDLQRHELASLLKQFFGNGVPDDNDGFHVEALAGGGVGTIVLQAMVVPETGVSSIEIDFDQSTAASLLGFLPNMASTQRPGSNPARLTGNATEPFALANGLTLAVQANGQAAEVVTFVSADFADITQATAAEVAAVLNAGLSRAAALEGTGNDFIIRGGDGSLDGAGRLIVEGAQAINETDLSYTSQPLYENPDLATRWGVDVMPAMITPAGTDRTDLVYIDVWDREVDAAEDDAMVLPAVGLEATVRLRREWAVRVAEGATNLIDISRAPGHRYAILARIQRTADAAAVAAEAVLDLRVRNLNVAKYLKTPIHYQRGQQMIDAERFASLLETLRSVLLTRLQNRVFDFSYADDYDQFLVLAATQDLVQQSAFGAIQARTGNFNNNDGLWFLDTLYDLQDSFVDIAESFGNVGGSAQAFIDGYRDRLDGASADNIAGLRPALDAGDFLAAADAQETINSWLSEPVNVLPEGDLVVILQSVMPTTDLESGRPFNITYRIESQLTSPQQQETINLSIGTVSASTWNMSLTRNQIVVDASGGQDIVVVNVTPQAGTVSVVFRLTATVARNPSITQSQESDPFIIGQPPPTDVFLQWSAPPLDQGRFPIQADSLPRTIFFQVDVVNTSETDTQAFELSHFVTPPPGDETDWTPLESSPASSVTATIDPGDTQTNTLSIINSPNASTVGAEGTLTIRATLVEENGSPVVDGKSRILEIPFVITA